MREMNPRFFKVHRPGWVKKMTDGSLKKKIEEDSKKAQQSLNDAKKTGDAAFQERADKKWENAQKNWKESSDSFERDKKALRRMMDDSRKDLQSRHKKVHFCNILAIHHETLHNWFV